MKLTKRLFAVVAASILGSIALPAAADVPAENAAINNVTEDVIAESAAVYATYQSDVSDVRQNPLSSADDIASSLDNLGGHNSQQLSNGFIAYSALVASQNPEFRAAVRDIEGFYGRDSLMLGLRNDVRYARTLGGGNAAVTSSLAAIEADADRLRGAGAFVKEQAYSLQAAGWAKAVIPSSDAMIQRIQSSASAGRPVRADLRVAFTSSEIDTVLAQAGQSGAPSLWENVNSAASAVRFPSLDMVYSGRSARIRAGKEPIADRIATLAAYRVLGTEAAPAQEVRTAMRETTTRNCINMAQLNLQQCVAAAHKQYEVPFCIGEHALTDVGDCIGDVTQ
ncbi:MAG: hypothetical protein MRY64_13685 [Hyphomonadaceae bacterium]|nr:hypothetical protein [Hyphomonadaceae bacterium]